MAQATELRFGAFRLAGKHGPLLRDGNEIKLQPKTQALLWALVRQPGEVVPKSVLMDSAWPGVIVGEDALTFQVQILRRALGDDPKSPRYVVTAHRVGFRFAVPVERAAAVADHASRFVGREAELQALQTHLASAARGHRRVVFVSGEAGMGKTTLIDAFMEQARACDASLRHARGQCAEQSRAGEPYLPILQALGQLLRQAPDEGLIELLRRAAPSWLLQLPGLIEADDYAALKRQTAGVSQQRMQRELAEALERLSVEHPLVLVLEDLHWSDGATVDLLALLAARREPARLLVLCSLRHVDAIVSNHPVRMLQLSLRSRHMATELALHPLPSVAVLDYLGRRFGPNRLGADLSEKIRERSGGHPLFLVQIADFIDHAGSSPEHLAAELDRSLPQGLQDLIELQLRQLSLTEQLALEAASVAGHEFSAAAAATAAGLDVDAAELHFENLVQRGQFIEAQGLAVWPDGTASGRYRFRHMLYAQVLRRRLTDSRRARLHRLIATRVESAFGVRTAEIAAELALHFEQGGVRAKALQYRIHTARLALERVAPTEAQRETALGLALLDALPAGQEHRQAELALRIIAAHASQAEHGYSGESAQAHVARIPSLLEGIGDPDLLQSAIVTLWRSKHFGGCLDEALTYAKQVRLLGVELGLPVLESLGHAWTSVSQQIMGRHRESERSSAAALRTAASVTATVPGVPLESACTALASRSLNRWYLGFADQALRAANDASDCVDRIGNPYLRCIIRVGAFNTALQLRREWNLLLPAAEAAMSLCRQYGHLDGLSWARRQRAVALCELDTPGQGLPELSEAIAAQRKTGLLASLPMDYTHVAAYCVALGRLDQARVALDSALAIVRDHGLRAWESEILRREGEWLLAREGKDSTAAVERFEQALQLAKSRQALSLQLRAAMSLARLRERQGQPQNALSILQPVCAALTEGYDTPDLIEAKGLLERLKRESP